jgi:hypothetical protein
MHPAKCPLVFRILVSGKKVGVRQVVILKPKSKSYQRNPDSTASKLLRSERKKVTAKVYAAAGMKGLGYVSTRSLCDL